MTGNSQQDPAGSGSVLVGSNEIAFDDAMESPVQLVNEQYYDDSSEYNQLTPVIQPAAGGVQRSATWSAPEWNPPRSVPSNTAVAQMPLLLSPEDILYFKQFGVSRELLTRFQIQRVTNEQARVDFGIKGSATRDMGGIVFPYWQPNVGHRSTCRVRRDHPKVDSNGKPLNKYMAPWNDPRHLYFPPDAEEKLKCQEMPICLVESEKSVLALSAWAERSGEPLLPIATGGCWGWRGVVGKSTAPDGSRVDVRGALADLSNCNGRTVTLLFDANAASNPKVHAARSALVDELLQRNCKALVCDLPPGEGINGPDDFIANHGDIAMQAVLASAYIPVRPERAPISVSGTAAAVSASDKKGEAGFDFVEIGELLSRPEIPLDYLVDGLIVRGTVSLTVAKPKTGKSTLARGLGLAVARGEPFLGRATKQGSCLYLALEERYEEVTADFRAMGADGTEPLKVHASATPEGAISVLIDLIRLERPALVIADPLFRLANIRDENSYAQGYGALGPLIDVARETGTHVNLLHHSGKSAKADAIDSSLGTTAFGGVPATMIVLRKKERYRTIETVVRIGTPMAETILDFDPETRLLSVGDTREVVDCQRIERGILELLEASGEKTEPEVVDYVEGTNSSKRKALRALVEQGKLQRAGTGKRSDAFRYSFARTEGVPRTSVQETEKPLQPRVSIEEKLVRESELNRLVVRDDLTGEDGRPCSLADGLPCAEEAVGTTQITGSPEFSPSEDEPFFEVEA